VIHKTDSISQKLVVELGEDAQLYCRTNAPWKKCFWRPPRSGVKQVNDLMEVQLFYSEFLCLINYSFVVPLIEEKRKESLVHHSQKFNMTKRQALRVAHIIAQFLSGDFWFFNHKT
jgi:hypothetical protein